MKLSILLIIGVVITGQLPSAFSGVLTLTSKGIQYLNNEQFAALQDPYMQSNQPTQQSLWRDGGSGGTSAAYPPVQDYEDDEDKSEPEVEEDEDELDEKEAKIKDDEDESEEKDVADDAPVESEEVKEIKETKYKVKAKKVKHPKGSKKSHKKKKAAKVKESSDELGDDESGEAEAQQPPMPPVLNHQLQMSEYDAAVNGVQQPDAPLLSRMTSYLNSLLGRGGVSSQSPYGSDPYFMNRQAKSLTSTQQRPNSKALQIEGSEDAVSRVKRDLEVLSRSKRQMKLKEVEIRPFYHVRNNIRTMVRRLPSTKLTPQPVDDFNNLSEKGSKPIKLFMEPYSAPQTYQSPPLSPAQGVRGPSSGGFSNPGGLGSPGLGQGAQQQGSAANSGGGKQGSSGGNKKNNNGSGNKGNNKESEEEDDSDENNSQEPGNFEEDDSREEAAFSFSGEDEDGGVGGNSSDGEEDEDDEYDEDYEEERK